MSHGDVYNGGPNIIVPIRPERVGDLSVTRVRVAIDMRGCGRLRLALEATNNCLARNGLSRRGFE